MKMEQTQCSETSAHKFQTPGNYLKERIHFIFFSEVSTLALGHTWRSVGILGVLWAYLAFCPLGTKSSSPIALCWFVGLPRLNMSGAIPPLSDASSA
jgi:hypothetical protein